MDYSMLLSPMKIGNLEIKNRTVMTAAEFSMGQANGKPTEKLMDYYEERAKGGVGLIIPGICRVNDMYATSSFTQLAMSHDYHIEPMREFVGRIHRHGAKLGIQLHHPGRQGYASSVNSLPMILPLVEKKPEIMEMLYKATPTMMALEEKGICQPVAAPSVCERSYHVPSPMRAMTKFEVKRTIQDFIDAAVRCKKAGVDLVELHAAHGYLIQQFLSPNTNHRKDEYGGSFDNRLRFISEIITGIKAACGKDYPLMVRLSADEMYDRIGKPGKGYDLEEGKRIAKRLEELGVDAINVSSACYDTYNYWLEPTSFEPGWRAYLAKAIKETVKIPVCAANFMRSPDQAERQLEEGAGLYRLRPHLYLRPLLGEEDGGGTHQRDQALHRLPQLHRELHLRGIERKERRMRAQSRGRTGAVFRQHAEGRRGAQGRCCRRRPRRFDGGGDHGEARLCRDRF